ncbi:hypothetical protein GCM10022198_13160 [Klugiella xanthotipulae]|uniref:Sortase A n=1 Tax=Klugiella xanthotipulae TaxID=244735 RepID=A0A543I4D0_9MICO|nr:class C sortase [Klugiella xanthotipulae]TQM65401.1 sortase A [Klugiella xanthotipulae]
MRASSAIVQRVMITLVALIGVLVLLFPNIANWFSTLGVSAQHGSYDTQVDELSEAEIAELIDSARDYNMHLPSGPLRDPYMLSDSGQFVDLRDDLETYGQQLNLGPGVPMGWIEIPRIDVSLPIRHGTEADTLEKGAGHLHGSALPVGGPSSHSVITAHSGRVTSQLFTELDRLRKGDVFFSDVLGERFYYRVDSIEIVEPTYSGEMLRQVAGEDYLTLLTCTPTGVNSHRLLVRGTRIDGPAAEELMNDIAATEYSPDFPWWIVVAGGVPTVVWGVLTRVDNRAQEGAAPPLEKGRRATWRRKTRC